MKEHALKKIIVVIAIMIVIGATIVAILLYNYNKVLIETASLVETKIEETTTMLSEESISKVNLMIEPDEEEIDESLLGDEERYIKYLSPKKNFIKTENREKEDVFYFAGDVFFSNHIRKSYDEGGVEAILDENFRNLFKSSDLNIANLECCITDNDENPDKKTFTFAFPTRYLAGLKKLNVDLFTIANNHILDFGMDALDSTIKELDNLNISHIGAGDTLYDAKKVYIKEIEGKRYAFLAASAVLPSGKWQANESHGGVFNGYEIESVVSEIKFIKPFFDKVIVYMHWGNELEETSNRTQNVFAHMLVDAGADFVIGTHAHTTQEIEYYNGVPIVYSLGNFIYGGQSRNMFICEATFDYSTDKDGKLRIKIYPGISGYKNTREYDTELEVENIYKNLNKKSTTCYVDTDGYVYSAEEKKLMDEKESTKLDEN